jgi:hypothetical protein
LRSRPAALALVALVFQTGVARFHAATPFTTAFELDAPAEAIATITARCDACAWDVAGREAVTLRISLDDRYVAHLPLVRRGLAEYRVFLGPAAAGRHIVRVQDDPDLTASDLRRQAAATVEEIHVTSVAKGDPEHTAISLAPFLYARANTIGRFTDVPVLMWYEREPAARGLRYRYSVIFTNEDGGTPADRLMATWGRTTDIEYIYSVEVDQSGQILADDLQGPDHEILDFRGTREGRHPLLWVSTNNNMVRDTGATRVRYAPAPLAFDLTGVSREAVMDAHPWVYRLAAQELAREGKIVEDSPPGRGTIPDPRRFVYLEACGEIGGAALAFDVGVRDKWERSDRGIVEYKIVRSGCFRGAVPVSDSVTSNEIRGIRFVAYARPSRDKHETTIPASVRIDRVNTVFMLDEDDRPGPPLLRWQGPAVVPADGSPLEILIPRP